MNENTATPNATLPAAAIDVHLVGDTPKTTSLNIAEVFGKRHDHVIRAIEALDCPEEFRAPNFGVTFYEIAGPNGAVRKEVMYELTKDGATLLIMGFTGRQAMRFKVAYIEEFNRLEARARRSLPGFEEPREEDLREHFEFERRWRLRFQAESTKLRSELLDVYRQLHGPRH